VEGACDTMGEKVDGERILVRKPEKIKGNNFEAWT
jgi:hypothetical protein